MKFMTRTDKYSLYDRLNQLQLLFWLFPERSYTTREIAEKLGINEDTALKDLQEMSESGRLPIIRKGWHWQLRDDVQFQLQPIAVPGCGEFFLLVQKVQIIPQNEEEPC